MDRTQTSAILSSGMRALREKLGVIEAEIFVNTIKQDRFDYTEWRRENLWAGKTLEEIHKEAFEYAENRGTILNDEN